MSFLLNYLPIAVFAVILLFFGVFLIVLKHYQPSGIQRHPFTDKLRRAPGVTLLHEMDTLNRDIITTAVFLFLFPLLLYATYVSQLYFNTSRIGWIDAGIYGGVGIVAMTFGGVRLVRRLRDRRRRRLEYDGSVAVGQELNHLMRAGFYVYHAFPADGFDIDHIVVGEKGVFAVETQARSEPVKNRLRDAATVEYNGRVLYFPGGKDLEIIRAAEQRAGWLAKWIEDTVGEPIAVRAVVALPGWFVKRTTADGIPVVNPSQFASLFEHVQPRPIPAETLARIIDQIERKCRDVDPVISGYDQAL